MTNFAFSFKMFCDYNQKNPKLKKDFTTDSNITMIQKIISKTLRKVAMCPISLISLGIFLWIFLILADLFLGIQNQS